MLINMERGWQITSVTLIETVRFGVGPQITKSWHQVLTTYHFQSVDKTTALPLGCETFCHSLNHSS